MSRDQSRRTEGSLLTLVVFILAAGFLLVFLAKTREDVPPDSINLNAASAEELALALEIDPALSKLLVRQRQRLGGFSSVKQAGHVSLFPDQKEANRVRDAIRTSGLDTTTAGVAELAKLLVIDRPLARRIIAYRDAGNPRITSRPNWVTRVPIVDEGSISGLGRRLIVRTPA